MKKFFYGMLMLALFTFAACSAESVQDTESDYNAIEKGVKPPKNGVEKGTPPPVGG